MSKEISIAELTRRYNAVVSDAEKLGKPENRTNCYVCSSGHITKTIDVDEGVTPMFHQCHYCENMGTSRFYQDFAPDLKPVQEWYRPSLEECIELNRKGELGLLEHILDGGLNVRDIK